jgi:hypothetical protein
MGARSLAVTICTAAFGLASPAIAVEVPRGEAAITCTNPISGASWQIQVDYDHSTVDSNPARITNSEITWRGETDRWNYSLDRKTGDLTVILASSTGGNFLHDLCKLNN